MATVLVIGYGSELRGDDSLGPRVAHSIAGRFPNVDCLAVPQLTPELAAPLAMVDAAIFVDALDDSQAQDVVVSPLDAVQLQVSEAATHVSDPGCLLALTQIVYGRRPAAWLVTIPGQDFAIGDKLSVKATGMLHVAIERVEALIAACLSDL